MFKERPVFDRTPEQIGADYDVLRKRAKAGERFTPSDISQTLLLVVEPLQPDRTVGGFFGQQFLSNAFRRVKK